MILPPSLRSGGSDQYVNEKKIQRSWAYLKIFSYSILVLLGAFFVGSFFSRMFFSGVGLQEALLLPLAIASILFLVFFFLLVFLTDVHVWTVYSVALVSACLMVMPLSDMGTREMLMVGVVLVVLFLWSVWKGRRESDTAIRIRFIKTFRAIMSGSMWGIILLASFLVYQTSVAHPADAYTILFPQSVFDSVTPMAESLLKPVLGDVDFSLTLREMAGKGIDATIQKSFSTAIQGSMTPTLRDALIQKYIDQAQQSLEKTLGIHVSPDQKLSNAMYQGLLAQFNGLTPQTQRGIVAFFTILFLFGLRMVAWVLGVVMIPIAFIFYEIAILTGFASRSFTQKSKEHIGIQ